MNPLLAQLYAVRLQLEAAIALLEDQSAVSDLPPPPEGCPHPQERQRNAATFGEPGMVLCLDCGLKHPGTA
jgi:hypothetical protein